jgi:predicted metal-binding membrane protein
MKLPLFVREHPAVTSERWLVLAGLAAVSALAWAYTAYLMARSRDVLMAGTMPQMVFWGGPDLALTFALWAVMMIAMMLPSMAPAALLFLSIQRAQSAPRAVRTRTVALLAGYLAVWVAFAALATVAQWGLHTLSLWLALVRASPLLGGALLAGAGLFQWSPLKHACLTSCRSPQSFYITHWRDGLGGAWEMGLQQGIECVGCCWLLMSLLLLAGAMNQLWMVALTALVLVEKAARSGEWIGRAAGVLLVFLGVWMIAGALLA